jgi:hypothetical protein
MLTTTTTFNQEKSVFKPYHAGYFWLAFGQRAHKKGGRPDNIDPGMATLNRKQIVNRPIIPSVLISDSSGIPIDLRM